MQLPDVRFDVIGHTLPSIEMGEQRHAFTQFDTALGPYSHDVMPAPHKA